MKSFNNGSIRHASSAHDASGHDNTRTLERRVHKQQVPPVVVQQIPEAVLELVLESRVLLLPEIDKKFRLKQTRSHLQLLNVIS